MKKIFALFSAKKVSLLLFLLFLNATFFTVHESLQQQTINEHAQTANIQHYEYVFQDGGISVYDMDNNHQQVKHISVPTNSGVRGVVGYAPAHMLYISYGSDGNSGGSLLAYDLLTDTVVWNKSYPFGIDSHAITPDGKYMYMPDGETSSSPYWYVINASDGSMTGAKINGGSGPHNTVVSLSGQHVYMGARNFSNSPTYLTVADTATNSNIRNIGPFKEGVRPFTINSSETLAYVTTTGFLGFQVADINSGKVIYTVDLTQLGFPNSPTGPTAPSHGIALSPDEKALAVIDWPNDMVHIFDVSSVSASAPRKTADIKFTRSMHHTESPCAYDCPADGWLEYSRDGRFLYIGDVGDVIDTSRNTVITNISTLYNTRKMLEVDFQNGAVSFVPSNRASVGFGSNNIPTPSTSSGPTAGSTGSPPPAGSTSISLTLCPHGIAKCGDNANPQSTGNMNPLHTQRPITVSVADLNNNPVTTGQGSVNFDSASGTFKGTVPLSGIASGQYIVKVTMPQYLTRQIGPSIIQITQGQTLSTGPSTVSSDRIGSGSSINTAPEVFLIAGDINGDNKLDILDYNILVSCFGSKQCNNKQAADLEDDGKVDGVDYNLFLRELSVQNGQ